MQPRVDITPERRLNGKLLEAIPAVRAATELSVVIPTFNERANVPELIRRLEARLAGVAWEAIVVDDDSPDGTSLAAKEIAARDPRVRCIRRVGRRGLAGACIEGILSCAAPVVAVIDADLQHDETILTHMLAEIRSGADLAVGTRYASGGSSSAGLSSFRQWGSETATGLARRFLGVNLSDPMSGFFMIRRERVEAIAGKLSTDGFKILLDIVASSPPLKTVEIPYGFRQRFAGESKLDTLVTAEYLGLLFSKLSGGLLPVRFLMFAAIGGSGVFVHLGALSVALKLLNLGFSWSQLAATLTAMTWNFMLNNLFTFRDRRLKGLAFFIGLATFCAVCSMGTIANVGVASWIHESRSASWWLAGLAGAVMGSVFNYAASSVVTWRNT
jgi:dolichol-phosphate mannosyltransferase